LRIQRKELQVCLDAAGMQMRIIFRCKWGFSQIVSKQRAMQVFAGFTDVLLLHHQCLLLVALWILAFTLDAGLPQNLRECRRDPASFPTPAWCKPHQRKPGQDAGLLRGKSLVFRQCVCGGESSAPRRATDLGTLGH
jgi:hypothetical protein